MFVLNENVERNTSKILKWKTKKHLEYIFGNFLFQRYDHKSSIYLEIPIKREFCLPIRPAQTQKLYLVWLFFNKSPEYSKRVEREEIGFENSVAPWVHKITITDLINYSLISNSLLWEYSWL